MMTYDFLQRKSMHAPTNYTFRQNRGGRKWSSGLCHPTVTGRLSSLLLTAFLLSCDLLWIILNRTMCTLWDDRAVLRKLKKKKTAKKNPLNSSLKGWKERWWWRWRDSLQLAECHILPSSLSLNTHYHVLKEMKQAVVFRISLFKH